MTRSSARAECAAEL